MKKILSIASVLSLFMLGSVFAADVVPPIVDLPGTQPKEVGNFDTPGRCDNCHGGYDETTYPQEPAFGWRGSAMGNAGRDPIFWATLAIAEQDFDGVGDLCIRCHSAAGWIAGRSTPTDGSGLGQNDADGIDCDTCHKSTNTDNSEHMGEMFEPFVANSLTTLEGFYGSGMTSYWGGAEKLGPYAPDDARAKHQRDRSLFHRSEDFCGTCHDVSNSVVGHLAPNHGAQSGAVANVDDLGSRVHPADGAPYVALNNPPYAYGIVERTFSEYKSSAFSGMPIADFGSLPAELRVEGGALAQAAYAQGADGNGDPIATFEDGATRYFTCQSCHMKATTGVGANKAGTPIRTDLPMHDLTGGNYWVFPLIEHQDAAGTIRMGGGLTATQSAAMIAGIQRAQDSLKSAASLDVVGDTLTVTNLTGHKLITGYPEGRRMWVNIVWKDGNGVEAGQYNEYGDLAGASTSYVDSTGATINFTPQTLLNPVKVYEVHPGISQAWAQTLVNAAPAVYSDIVLGYDPVDGSPQGTIGQLAAGTLGVDSAKTFHFVLNNTVIDDNRIPPYGMTLDEAERRNALPEPADQYNGLSGTFEHWDTYDLAALAPTEAVSANITLYYQGTSWEYIQFLWKANQLPAGSFLADEGVNMLDAWVKTGMVPPFAMASTTWGQTSQTCTEGNTQWCDTGLSGVCADGTETCSAGAWGTCVQDSSASPEICDDGVDNDCDGLTDADDPDCQTTMACADYPDKGSCNNDPNCEWVGSPKNGTCQDVPVCTPLPEVCDDGIDNDCDGLTDCADAECELDPVCTTPTDCAAITTKDVCNSEPTCTWSNRNKTCQPI